jgi:hypothetical protein
MKHLIILITCMTLSISLSAQKTSKLSKTPNPLKKTINVEASCGQCQFEMPGFGCNLAIRLDGTVYFVEGTDLDDHGDAHAHDGFCNKIRKAEVQGEIVGDKFIVTYFDLKNDPPKVKPKK